MLDRYNVLFNGPDLTALLVYLMPDLTALLVYLMDQT